MAGKFYTILSNYDIDDMVQDAWFKIHGMQDRYDERKNFEGWVYRICQNYVRDTTPKFTKHRDKFSSYDDYGLEDSGYCSELADNTFAADNDIIEREDEAIFKKALREMSDTERDIVLMARDGYTNSDMAEALGITDGNLRIKKHRAYKVLDKYGIKIR
jgi:RNA polymerase sigma factor (sigma-70 family)